MNMEYKFLQLNIEQGIAFVTFNRESKLNAINSQVLTELKDLLIHLKRQSLNELTGVILTGAGEKAFIAGADIAELTTLNPSEALEVSKLGQEVSSLLENFNRPILAAVNGHAMGGGLEMALSCDFIVMTSNALLALPEVKLGLIPGFGGTKRLTNILGPMKAKEIIFSGRTIKADEALSLGLTLKVFSTKDEMLLFAKEWLLKTKNNSLRAIHSAKKAIHAGMGVTTTQALALEAEYFSQLFGTEDMLEGTKAFMEKRTANFKQG
jgi:enoyl-CoA hydratase